MIDERTILSNLEYLHESNPPKAEFFYKLLAALNKLEEMTLIMVGYSIAEEDATKYLRKKL